MLIWALYKICELECERKIVFVLILITVLIFRTISGSHSCWKTLSMIPFWGHWGYNCGLGRSPKWPGSRRKKIDKELWNLQFLSYTNIISKESWERSSFRFKIKLGDFVMKNWKNSILWFSIPKKHNLGSVSAEFLENLSR